MKQGSCGTEVEPLLVRVAAEALRCGHLVDLDSAFAEAEGVPPSSTCRFVLDGAPGRRKDIFLTCPDALTGCEVLLDRWFRPHFSVMAEFCLEVWIAEVQFARAVSPVGPACWLNLPGKSRSSPSKVVQGIWDICLGTLLLVPVDDPAKLHKFCHLDPDADAAWKVWSGAAEGGLLAACKPEGGSYPQDDTLCRAGSCHHPNQKGRETGTWQDSLACSGWSGFQELLPCLR